MKNLKFGTSILFVVFIFGCSAIQRIDQYDAYRDTVANDKPLVLPKDMRKDAIKDSYHILKINVEDVKEVSVKPPRVIGDRS